MSETIDRAYQEARTDLNEAGRAGFAFSLNYQNGETVATLLGDAEANKVEGNDNSGNIIVEASQRKEDIERDKLLFIPHILQGNESARWLGYR